MRVGDQVSSVASVVEVILSLDERRAREFEIACELARAEATETLSDRARPTAR
jgi:hypothetical protein